MGSPENILIEQTESPKSVESLKADIIDFLLPNFDSNMAEEFMEFFYKNDLSKYTLAKVFLAIINGEKPPEQSKGELFDTDDGKIEKFINEMIINVQEKAA